MNHARRMRRWLTIVGYALLIYLLFCLLQGIAPHTAILRFTEVWKQTVMPFVSQMVIFMFIMVVQFVVLFAYMSRGRTSVIYPNEYDVTFDDIRGQQPAVDATREVLRLFLGFKRFREMGGYPPHGILFEGPPGTGKTLMAKAVAGEASVPFIYASGSSFSAMFMGVGNMRIASLFRKARKFSDKYGGAVIFLDELDAVGGSRGSVDAARSPRTAENPPAGGFINRVIAGMGMGAGSMLVNELLVQMDGMTEPKGLIWRRIRRHLLKQKPVVQNYNILIIGATNRSDTLDPALLRPGRFDRKIHVGNPDAEGRKDIIQYYLDKVRHEPIDLDRFARATIGYSPARIKNVVNEALIMALQDGRTALGWGDVWKAKMIDEIGLAQPVQYTPREKLMTAAHESGHAVAAYFLQRGQTQIQVATIIKREHALGLVQWVELEERFSRTKEDLLARIQIAFAGMCAEEIWFGTTTSGTSGDLHGATVLAAQMVGTYGMRDGLVSWQVVRSFDQPDPASHMMNDPETREEIAQILRFCKDETTKLLRDKSVYVEAIRDRLLEKEELYGDEIDAIMRQIEAEEAQGIHPPAGAIAGGSEPPLHRESDEQS